MTRAAEITKTDSNKFRVSAHDLRVLINRYAINEQFNLDSKGGGPESNINLIPLLLSMGLFFITTKNFTTSSN